EHAMPTLMARHTPPRTWLATTLLVITALLSGCQSPPTPNLHEEVTVLSPTAAALLLDEAQAREALYAQYREWPAVRYGVRGLSKGRSDCSGFVYLTSRARFGIALPRSTAGEAVLGYPIGESESRTGDLVFSRAGRNVRHVGIFPQDRQ